MGIQTWVLSLQLCLKIVDDLNHLVTTAGFSTLPFCNSNFAPGLVLKMEWMFDQITVCTEKLLMLLFSFDVIFFLSPCQSVFIILLYLFLDRANQSHKSGLTSHNNAVFTF